MARVIQFEQRALASLRAQLGEANEDRADLIAFAQGHWGATRAIHRAVLGAIAASSFEALIDVISGDWPRILKVDSIALALGIGPVALMIDGGGLQRLDAAWLGSWMAQQPALTLRAVPRGHAAFGRAAGTVRAQALIPIHCGSGLPSGLLALGQRKSIAIEDSHGGELLRFLGDSLGAIIARWLTETNQR